MLELMLQGVSTRKYEWVLPALADQAGASKSEVSRQTIEARTGVLQELAERDPSERDVLVVHGGYRRAVRRPDGAAPAAGPSASVRPRRRRGAAAGHRAPGIILGSWLDPPLHPGTTSRAVLNSTEYRLPSCSRRARLFPVARWRLISILSRCRSRFCGSAVGRRVRPPTDRHRDPQRAG